MWKNRLNSYTDVTLLKILLGTRQNVRDGTIDYS